MVNNCFDMRWPPKIGLVVKLCDYGGYGLGDTPNLEFGPRLDKSVVKWKERMFFVWTKF